MKMFENFNHPEGFTIILYFEGAEIFIIESVRRNKFFIFIL